MPYRAGYQDGSMETVAVFNNNNVPTIDQNIHTRSHYPKFVHVIRINFAEITRPVQFNLNPLRH